MRRIPLAFMNSGCNQPPAGWHGDPFVAMVVNVHSQHAVTNARWLIYEGATLIYDSGLFGVQPYGQGAFLTVVIDFVHTSVEFSGTCNGEDISQSFGGGAAQYVVEVPYTGDDDYGLIPAMTSHHAPSGHASALSEWSGGSYPAWWAFDRVLSHDVFQCWSDDNGQTFPQWVRYEFPTAMVVKRYRIYPFPGDTFGPEAYGRNPKDFSFQGSNDGSAWTTLDTQTSQTDWANGGAAKMFTFSNSAAYKTYRLLIAANNGGSNNQISQLQMFATP